MFTRIRARNFKSWEDTGPVDLSRVTVFFGTNSSGKTSLLQTLLLMKQTTASSDRSQILNLGGESSPAALGLIRDVMFNHDLQVNLQLEYSWSRPERHRGEPEPLVVRDPLQPDSPLFQVSDLTFSTHLGVINRRLQVGRMEYHAGAADVVLSRANRSGHRKRPEYDLQATVNNDPDYLKRGTPGRAWKLPPPVKCYGFPGETFAYFSNSDFVSVLELDLERQFNDRLFYLGPLRQFPARRYAWQGSTPSDVGVAGERTIEALLSSRGRDPVRTNARKYDKRGYAIRRISVEQHVAEWLKELNLVDDFDLEQVSPGIDLYRVMVHRQTESTRVTLADVGFGVSQVLPVLALLAYVPEGSTVLLEQPELHLHPAVQSGLADVILEAATARKVQVIVESHSEHLLRRLQRRLAEQGVTPDDVGLFFCENHRGRSHLQPLKVNDLGEIRDWPDGFFGDALGESVAIVEARNRR